VNKKIIVELRQSKNYKMFIWPRLINYLEVYNMKTGLLIKLLKCKIAFNRVMKLLGKVLGPTIDPI